MTLQAKTSTGPTAVLREITNPRTRRVAGTAEDMPANHVTTMVDELRAAQPAWEALGVADRIVWVRRLHTWVRDNDTKLIDLLEAETGKPRAEALTELAYVLEVLAYYCRNGVAFLAEKRVPSHGVLSLHKKLAIVRRPYAVVGVISPWNYPLGLALIDAIPALIAGAAVVIKPSELTPLSTRELVRGWIEEIGGPDVLRCATGTGEAGNAVAESVDFIQFTGSTRTGKLVAAKAAERLIPCSLELGGKDAMVILADADLERASNAAVWGSMSNAGQMCVSVERVYVEASAYDEFLRLVTAKVARLKILTPDGKGDVGPFIATAQLDIVQRHVDDAVKRGATLVAGGHALPGPGSQFEPTLLINVDHTMDCMTEETFGPILSVMKVADRDEAVELANDSRYGLSASVWSKDPVVAGAVARRLEAGAVNINDVVTNLLALTIPHSGWKESGLGSRLGGSYGVEKYCRTQAITTGRIAPRSEPQWFPYSDRKTKIMRQALRHIGGGRKRG